MATRDEAHLPAFARHAREGDFGMMAEPIASFGEKEFRKNSINIDKFTGFFDKFPKIKWVGNDAAGPQRREILP